MSMLPIKYLTIHCAATPEGRDHTAAEVNSWDIARPDLRQIAYHWIIERSGNVVRSLRDDQMGAHVGKHNSGNIGVCFVGGVENRINPKTGKYDIPKDTRTPEQEAAMGKLVDMYRLKYPNITVLGHRDWPGVAKACPSFSVSDWLAKRADALRAA